MKYVSFGSLCNLRNGRAFKPEEWSEQGTPIVRIQNLNDESKPFNYCNFEVEEKFWVNTGDLLFSWSGTPGTSFGAFFWNRGRGFLNQHIFRVDINEALVDKAYLRYALNSLIDKIIDQSHGGVGLKHITKAKLENVQIPLPPIPEQRLIAAILDKADALRAKRREAIAKLDQLLQSVFLEVFGDPMKNPKGWRVSTIGDECGVGSGSTPSRQVVEHFDGDIPWVKSTEVNWGRILETGEHVSAIGKKTARLKIYPVDTVVVALYGQGTTRGKCAILGTPATMNQACAGIHPSTTVNSKYLFHYLKGSYTQLRGESRGGNQENLNLGILKSFALPVPPLALQQQFASFSQCLEKQSKQSLRSAETMDNLFFSFQHKAFTGDI